MTRQILFIILMLITEVVICAFGICTNNQSLIQTISVIIPIILTVGWISSFNKFLEIWWNKKIKFKK